MPRRYKQKDVYKFSELSPQAKEKAVETYTGILSEHYDSAHLSDQFKSILEERGIEEPDVCWSLGYSQGDGVAFWGHLDLPKFFNFAIAGDHPAYTKKMKGKVKPFIKLQDFVHASVRNSGRECHWNSMSIDLEENLRVEDLISEDRRHVLHYLERRRQAIKDYEQHKYLIEMERERPVREWERKQREREKLMSRGPKEWRPGNAPRPEPLAIPDAVLQLPEEPADVRRELQKAEAAFKSLESLIPSFEQFLEEWVKDTSRELEKMGYDEIEYQSSREAVMDFIEANAVEFNEDGEPV